MKRTRGRKLLILTVIVIGVLFSLLAYQWLRSTELLADSGRFSLIPVMVSSLGVLLSTLLAFWLRQTMLHEEEVERLVEERTRALELSEARTRAILDIAVDGIVVIDERGLIRLFNPGAEALFGYRADEVIGRNVSCLMPEPHRSAHDGYLQHYLKTGEAHVIGIGREVEGTHKDGRRIPLHLSVGAASVQGETIFVGVLKDMAEEQERRRALTEARDTAERLRRQQSAFINTISHELRTPLTVILGYLPLLKNRDAPLPADAIAEIAEEMDQSGKHLLDLINDVLDLSKIEAERMVLLPQRLDLAEQVGNVLKRFARQAEGRKVVLESDCDGIRLEADPKRLLQILTNLVGNALKFTRDGRIAVSARPDGDEVVIEVRDSGIGIAAEQLPHIFTPFYQVDSSRTRTAGGTGLGLAITRQLVTMHGGSIEVESEPGQGTCFRIRMPQRQSGTKGEETNGKDTAG